jgi:hypothetical protein
MFTVSANMKTQDIWFLMLISAIWAELRLVGDIRTFKRKGRGRETKKAELFLTLPFWLKNQKVFLFLKLLSEL